MKFKYELKILSTRGVYTYSILASHSKTLLRKIAYTLYGYRKEDEGTLFRIVEVED